MVKHWTNPPWLPDKFAYDEPKDEWARFQSEQPQFFRRQKGLGDWDRRMRARYMLGAPQMAVRTGADPSYFDYLKRRSPPTGAPPPMQSYQDLLGQAQEAARAGVTAPGPYLTENGAITNQDEFNRRAWLSSQFAGNEAATNQIAVANLLALQRNRGATGPGGPRGAYSGQMGEAIRQAISAMYQQRLNVGEPKETFLDWYLRESGQGAGAGARGGPHVFRGKFEEAPPN